MSRTHRSTDWLIDLCLRAPCANDANAVLSHPLGRLTEMRVSLPPGVPSQLVALLSLGAVWRRLAERGLVPWAPGFWITLAFAVAVVGYGGMVVWRDRDVRPPMPQPAPWMLTGVLALVMCGAAAALYRPILHIGLLADDFALLQSARNLELASARWEYLRPFGLLTWWAAAQIDIPTDVDVRLHLLNVLLHGVNAALVGRLATGLGTSPTTAVCAAALFLVSPLATEPVIWCSAVFDVLLTMFALALCIIIVRQRTLSPATYVLCLALGVLMVATKETGVIAGPLALLAHWTRWGYRNRSGYIVGAMLGMVAVAYAVMRHLLDRLDSRVMPAASVESVRRLFTQSFAALFVPLHNQFLDMMPLAAVVVPIALIVLLAAWTRRWSREPEGARLALFAAGTVVLALAPAITTFGVGGDLQGSRYLYLPMGVWAIALASALLDGPSSKAWWSTRVAVAVLTVLFAVVAVTAHFEPWREARRVRDGVLLKLSLLPSSCVRVHARGIPDHVAGAYVFRNGLTEGAATIGRDYEFVRESQAEKECQIDLSDARAPVT